MIAADRPDRGSARLLVARCGRRHAASAAQRARDPVRPGDLVVANDAATLPASLQRHACRERRADRGPACGVGVARRSDALRRHRLRGGRSSHAHRRPAASAAAFAGRPPLARPARRDGRAAARPSSPFVLRFSGAREAVLAGLARHGRPIQYAHVPEPLALWDVWTRIAADPVAFEPPSAGFALDWRTLAAWRRRGVGFATLTHAAGISSTGDPMLDLRLPFDEPYRIPDEDRGRDRAGEGGRRAASSRSGRRWSARWKPPRRRRQACAPETASRADASRAERGCGRRRHPHRRAPARRKPFRAAAGLRRRRGARSHLRGAGGAWLPRSRVRRFHADRSPGLRSCGRETPRAAGSAPFALDSFSAAALFDEQVNNHSVECTMTSDPLSATLSALADPTRRGDPGPADAGRGHGDRTGRTV